MLRRPQRTEDRLRAGGEDGAYRCGSLEGGGELKQLPRAQLAEAACGWSASTGRTFSLARTSGSKWTEISGSEQLRSSYGIIAEQRPVFVEYRTVHLDGVRPKSGGVKRQLHPSPRPSDLSPPPSLPIQPVAGLPNSVLPHIFQR